MYKSGPYRGINKKSPSEHSKLDDEESMAIFILALLS